MQFRIHDVIRGDRRFLINEPVGLADPGPTVIKAPCHFVPAEARVIVNDILQQGNRLFMPDQPVILGTDCKSRPVSGLTRALNRSAVVPW